MMKFCPKCKINKELINFYTRSDNRLKYQSWCKECSKNYKTAAVRHKQRHKNIEKYNEQKRASRKRNPITYMLKAARKRARFLGLEYNLNNSDISIPKYCPVLGIELVVGGPNKDFSPSLDRIDNNKGYIKGNVIVVSYRCNRIKNNSNEEERRLLSLF